MNTCDLLGDTARHPKGHTLPACPEAQLSLLDDRESHQGRAGSVSQLTAAAAMAPSASWARLCCPWALLLLLVFCTCLQNAAGQLTDAPLQLPGRPARRPGAAAATAAAASSGPDPDERTGYFPIPGTQRRVFYWYFQARQPSSGAAIASAPLIAWLQGGPGCSSLFGLFFENGPYTVTEQQTLADNPNAWTSVANMLYIDQPVGTGLSYSNDPSDGTASELDVARTLAAFFKAFYNDTRYSALSKSKLVLAGESFAGHYIPAAAAYLKANAPTVPLAGIAMGNPFTHGPTMYEAYPVYAYQKGLLSEALFRTIVDNLLPACKLQSALCSVLDPDACGAAFTACETNVWGLTLSSNGFANRNIYNIKQIDANRGNNWYADLDSRLETYINNNRARLGVPPNVTFQSCADSPYQNLKMDMTRSYDDLVAALLDSGVSVLVYNGDDDFVCNSLGNARWVDGLLWSRQPGWARTSIQPWAGGTFRRLGPLAFVRVARSGHMVPMDQPVMSLQLMQQWLAQGQPTPKRLRP